MGLYRQDFYDLNRLQNVTLRLRDTEYTAADIEKQIGARSFVIRSVDYGGTQTGWNVGVYSAPILNLTLQLQDVETYLTEQEFNDFFNNVIVNNYKVINAHVVCPDFHKPSVIELQYEGSSVIERYAIRSIKGSRIYNDNSEIYEIEAVHIAYYVMNEISFSNIYTYAAFSVFWNLPDSRETVPFAYYHINFNNSGAWDGGKGLVNCAGALAISAIQETDCSRQGNPDFDVMQLEGRGLDKYRLSFVKLGDVFDVISDVYKEIYNEGLGVTMSYGIDFITNTRFYKQTYDNSGDLGNVVSYDSAYVLFTITNSDAYEINLWDKRDGIYKGALEYATLAEFIQDFIFSNLEKGVYSIHTVETHSPFVSHNPTKNIKIDGLPADIKIDFSQNKGRNIEIGYNDGYSEDVAYTSNDKRKGSSEPLTVSVIYNNLPKNANYIAPLHYEYTDFDYDAMNKATPSNPFQANIANKTKSSNIHITGTLTNNLKLTLFYKETEITDKLKDGKSFVMVAVDARCSHNGMITGTNSKTAAGAQAGYPNGINWGEIDLQWVKNPALIKKEREVVKDRIAAYITNLQNNFCIHNTIQKNIEANFVHTNELSIEMTIGIQEAWFIDFDIFVNKFTFEFTSKWSYLNNYEWYVSSLNIADGVANIVFNNFKEI